MIMTYANWFSWALTHLMALVQVVYADVYMLDDEMKWKVLPPMPKPNSHVECAWVILNNSIVITGGTTEKNPITKRMILVGEVFQFHLDSMVLIFLLLSSLGPQNQQICIMLIMIYIYHSYINIIPSWSIINMNVTDVVSDREASLPSKNHINRVLGWLLVFYIWAARQRTR